MTEYSPEYPTLTTKHPFTPDSLTLVDLHDGQVDFRLNFASSTGSSVKWLMCGLNDPSSQHLKFDMTTDNFKANPQIFSHYPQSNKCILLFLWHHSVIMLCTLIFHYYSGSENIPHLIQVV